MRLRRVLPRLTPRRVAIAVGGNGEILPDADGGRTLRARDLPDLLLGLRSRAEKQLARPVTHAVIAADAGDRAGLEAAAAEAGLEILRLVDRATSAALVRDAAPEEAAVLGAAIAAEEVMPASPAT